MGGRDELHAALGDRARGRGLLLGADLVDDDDLGHVVLDRFDHDRVLERRCRDLHAPRASDAGVRDVAVARDLVRRIDDHHALREVVREYSRDLAEHRRLAYAGSTEKQDASPRLDDVADDLDGAVDGAADAERQTDDLPRAIPQRADAMQSALDARAVVAAELPDVRDDIREILGGHFALRQHLFTAHEARFRETTEIHHDLEETLESVQRAHALRKIGWKSPEQRLELVALLHSLKSISRPP